jgi:hypothetical protein
MQTRNTTFMMTMRFVISLSHASEFLAEEFATLAQSYPGKPSGFNVKRILGNGDLWITEYVITYEGRPSNTVSIMEFRNGKVVHETEYLRIPSRRRPGEHSGSSRWRDTELVNLSDQGISAGELAVDFQDQLGN